MGISVARGPVAMAAPTAREERKKKSNANANLAFDQTTAME
jgi:hypothetical protein